MRPFALVAFVLLTACGPQPTDLLGNPEVVRAIRAYHDQGGACSWGCNDTNEDDLCTDDEFNGGDEVIGTWVFDENTCKTTHSDTGFGVGQRCAGEVTYESAGGNQIEQVNHGAVSSGEGGVMFATRYHHKGGWGPYDRVLTVLQENHATGLGCEQDLINLVSFYHLPDVEVADEGSVARGEGTWTVCALNVVLDSTCDAGVTWAARISLATHDE